MKLGVLQLCSSDLPEENCKSVLENLSAAKAAGAELLFTPEVTNCVSLDRTQQKEVLRTEENDQTLRACRKACRDLGIALNLGSLAIKTNDADGRFANRSFFIDAEGNIAARYDKIHMFDVRVSENEQYRESSGYRPGSEITVVHNKNCRVGLSICYDLRFPSLFRRLAQAGADILSVPSAFSVATGVAHWETLLQARAIETGSFVVAAAQTGKHPSSNEKIRSTYGHSLVVSPWGEVLSDSGTQPGLSILDIDLAEVQKARHKIPSLNDAEYKAPDGE